MDGNNINDLDHLTPKQRKNKRAREAYQSMPPEKKNELLQRKRDAYYRKKMRTTELSTAIVEETAQGQISSANDNQKSAAIAGTGNNIRRKSLTIPDESVKLPETESCTYCKAIRFYSEPPKFCCCEGQISLNCPPMPYDLRRLLLGDDEQCEEFRRNIRTYNNNFGFTTFAAKYDPELTKNKKGVYTFKIQGQVYHFLNDLHESGEKPSGIQLYFYDTDMELSARQERCPQLNPKIIKLLMEILSRNPYTIFFKSLRELPNIDNHHIILNKQPGLDQRLYNLPSVSQVAAILTEKESNDADKSCHIQVYTHSNSSHRIHHDFGCYDPLQYPLLFPLGQSGWHYGIERVPTSKKGKGATCNAQESVDFDHIQSAYDIIESENRGQQKGKKKKLSVTCREYYCYKLQIRPNESSFLLQSGRLLQQYVIDMYIKLESERLDFHRRRQKNIRTDLLQGLLDSIHIGETRASKVGKKIILPPSFIGGPRDMRKRYIDAMSLVQRFGKPDIFLTITCNPKWPEIQEHLLPNELPQNRPDLLSRVFRAKLEVLKDLLIKKQILGEIAAYVYVVEFQKRGLPHAHFLLIMKPHCKPLNPDAYDRIVSAEIPNQQEQPYLYSLVINHMMHGPCGTQKPDNPCMKNGKCKNHYPKEFSDYTTHNDNSYPIYRRRNDGQQVNVRGCFLDNRWVVPYNPFLLAYFDCHLNVEICSTIKLVKYLYKYVYKGLDKISFGIAPTSEIDEIQQYQSARWISPPEAIWRLYAFALSENNPPVIALQIHLPKNQPVSFDESADLRNVVDNPSLSRTMLTEFFHMNSTDHKAKEIKCLYRNFPEYFTWSNSDRRWSERKAGKTIGRIVTVNPTEGERYYLRLLLNHIAAPTSFEELLTVNNSKYGTFREAAYARGYLDSDDDIVHALQEAASTETAFSMRRLFAIALVYCSPSKPKELWEKFEEAMSEDFLFKQHLTKLSRNEIRMKVVSEIDKVLETMGKREYDFNFAPCNIFISDKEKLTRELETERRLVVSEQDLHNIKTLNEGQRKAYDEIMKKCLSNEGGAFFVDGPGGTGKTYLYKALLAGIRSQGYIALATATSGVAACILPGGRTAHSRFKIPLDNSENNSSRISRQSTIAKLLCESKLIIWDEAAMAKKDAIEYLDTMLKDITEKDELFGGKVVVLGGDFRQILPVIPKSSRTETVSASLVASQLWSQIQKLKLTENMRAKVDPAFSKYLLRIGNGIEKSDSNDNITIPPQINLPFVEKEESLSRLIEFVYPSITDFISNPSSMMTRAILTPKNSNVEDINQIMLQKMPGVSKVYTSVDKTIDESQQGDYEDFLNTLEPNGLPPHKLTLKENCPVMLLRNIDPTEGLCNGTRLICKKLLRYTIQAEIAVGEHCGKPVTLIPIPLQSSDDEKHGIPFKRRQFPIKLCFAMTINKAQGQTLETVGIYLREPVFSHGQLYVALSRAKKSASVRILIVPPTFEDVTETNKTRNVVYREVLSLAHCEEQISGEEFEENL